MPETSSPDSDPSSSTPSLLGVSFNQDRGCFSAAATNGFRVLNCDPFREVTRDKFDDGDGDGGGFSCVEMLFRCNVYALVGGGPHPQYSPNRVMIWDDTRHRCIGEISFGSEVRSVRLRRDRVVVVLDHKTAVHDFRNLERLHEFETAPNPKGLCEITQQLGAMVMVCLGRRKGQVRVDDFATKRTTFISAHDSRIACLSVSQDGRFVATASSKGTLVRVFCSVDGTLLQELRRGADRAEIYSLAFPDDVQYLAVSSDKGTVHVFNLNVNLGVTWTN